tara:strand:- start:244 stop:528 length:285 start_codon:yes stop_codon:yes gene_type:complete
MSIIDLGNGKIMKNGVVFDEDARKYCTEINRNADGKIISKTFKHCEGPLYPEMDEKDHAEEENMQDYDSAHEMNTEDLMEYFRDCDRLEEIAQC